MNVNSNVIMDVLGVAVILVVFVKTHSSHRKAGYLDFISRFLMFFAVMVLCFDMAAWLFDGKNFSGVRGLLWFLDTAYWVVQSVYSWLWFVFSVLWNYGEGKRARKVALLSSIPAIVEIILLFINIKTGWIFVINELNVYSRGSFYFINTSPFYLYILGALAVTLVSLRKKRGHEQQRKSLSLLLYMFLPILGVVIQTIYYGVSWIWPFVALSLLMVYVNMQLQEIAAARVAEAEKKEQIAILGKELLENDAKLMLSQIQPHFLYNTLASIGELCVIDAKQAQKAIYDFSFFLRGNMSSLTIDKPLPFEKELEHTRHYLELEKMRFGERLTIVYDICVTLFRIPTLCLQPIVENAVRYGVSKREEGGIVTIASYETETAFIVTVTDNGVGFDPNAICDNDRTHVGIANVRERLHSLVNGTLEVSSVIGEGTFVKITIPKTEEESRDNEEGRL